MDTSNANSVVLELLNNNGFSVSKITGKIKCRSFMLSSDLCSLREITDNNYITIDQLLSDFENYPEVVTQRLNSAHPLFS